MRNYRNKRTLDPSCSSTSSSSSSSSSSSKSTPVKKCPGVEVIKKAGGGIKLRIRLRPPAEGTMVDARGGEFSGRSEGFELSCDSDVKKSLKYYKKTNPNEPAPNIPCLLSTGLFEGFPVVYRHYKHQVQLPGIIKDQGYACGCSLCNYTRVLSALEFERHSGATSKHQNNHIFLPNGKTLHVIIKELKDVPLNALDTVVEGVIGRRPNLEKYEVWKEIFCTTAHKLVPTHNVAASHQPQFDIGTSPILSSELARKSNQISGLFIRDSLRKERPSSCIIHNSSLKEKPSGMNHNYPTTETEFSGLSVQDLPKESFSSCEIQDVHGTLKSSKPFVQDSFVKEKYSVDQKLPISRTQGQINARLLSQDMSGIQEQIMQLPVPKKGSRGLLKKRDNGLHSLIFKETGLPDGSELAYWFHKKKLLEGYKLGNGIMCSCCNTEVSPSQFESHAGFAKKRQPYRHIYTSNGLSLHELSVSLSNGRNLTAIYSDNECTICGDGGDLLRCSGCPKAFHIDCLELRCIPDGEWHCPYCKDSFASREAQLTGTRPITLCVRRDVIEVPATEIGGCAICRSGHYSRGVFDYNTVLLCDQCEKEYHVGCLSRSGLCDLKDLPRGNWFCREECNTVHSKLEYLIWNGAQNVPCSLSQILKRRVGHECIRDDFLGEVKWQLLSGKIRSPENKLLLSKAAAIFRNGFAPIVGPSGCDLVPAMVYGRSIGGKDFVGMYCMILTIGSLVVSAGIVRIFGTEVAELPLVATAEQSQGKGYFRCLFSCIEMLLAHLDVANLVLPAAEDAESMWTNKFGFRKMTENRLEEYIKVLPIMMFQGTSMLEKSVSYILY